MNDSNYEYYHWLLQSLQPSSSYFETMKKLYVLKDSKEPGDKS